MNGPAGRSGRASWIPVAIAWTLVGIPLVWGIYKTFQAAVKLFR
jgi:hypothetical protein